MKYRYQRLEGRCRDFPEYDHHVIHGLVDEWKRPIVGVFVHREGHGINAVSGGIATSGGGIRWRPNCTLQSSVEAFTDGLRLSSAMSKKSAGLEISLGGAKTVVFGHNITPRVSENSMCSWPWEVREEIWNAFAKEVLPNVPGYVIAEDVGTTWRDAKCIKGYAPSAIVTGCTAETDSSPTTAEGMMVGLPAVIHACTARERKIAQRSYAIQGVGAVGGHLAKLLWERGARDIRIADISQKRLTEVSAGREGIRIVPIKTVHAEDVDVFMPCALGGTLNERTIPEINAPAVAGCANNQLAEPEDGTLLHDRGIMYAPDYIINAGGMVQVICSAVTGEGVEDMLPRIGRTLEHIFEKSRRSSRPTSIVAEEIVAARMAQLMVFPT